MLWLDHYFSLPIPTYSSFQEIVKKVPNIINADIITYRLIKDSNI